MIFKPFSLSIRLTCSTGLLEVIEYWWVNENSRPKDNIKMG
jgi:hypothetical protein